MGYGKKIYEDACAELARRKARAEQTAEMGLQKFYRQCPRAKEIREEMAVNSARAAKTVISGGDVRRELEKLKTIGLGLNAEFSALLSQNGFTEREITPQYTCGKCRDTGFQDGRMCSCLKALQRQMAYEKLCMDVPLSESTFDSFSLDYYKEDERTYQQMSNILRVCKEYACKFRADSSNLFFKGGTGLGKTHLSLAIANAAIQKGYGVIYGSAQTFAVALEKERFDRADLEGAGDTNSQLIACDLLILDDLGMEFPSAYVNAALYNVIDTRMLAKRPTIISTNLTLKELEKRYGERFVSRITGNYGMLEFIGSDIRRQKRMQRKSKKQL